MAKNRHFSSGRWAKFVCDRSGLIYPYAEGVREPGTNLFVHISEVDWENYVTHPQLHPPRDISDTIALENPRPEPAENSPGEIPVLLTNDNDTIYTDKDADILCKRELFP